MIADDQMNLTTRLLTVATLHRLIEPLSNTGLRLLIRQLAVNVSLAAHEYCALTGRGRPLQRALIKHNVSVPWELHQLLQEREQSDRTTTNEAKTSGDAIYGSN